MLSNLEKWYARQCNGDWEHSWGVHIGTLDNPGWSVVIDLDQTSREDAVLAKTSVERTDRDWITYYVSERKFRIFCGPENLSEALSLFVEWFDRK